MRLALVASLLLACGDDPSPTDTSADAATDAPAEVIADIADAADADADAPDAAPPPSCTAPALPSLALTQDGRVLRDALGREVWLRGVNAGGRSKLPPFMPFAFAPHDPDAPPFSDALAAYLDRARDWGLNVLRLPFTWEAVEPTRGTYDEAFLGHLDAYLAAAAERGLRVVLDMHQDVFARAYCGDGFPPWAMADPDRPHATDCASWFTHYFQDDAMQADFDRFWSNADGLMDAYEAMWTMIATRYRDAPAVIGFEPINEPGWGSHDPITFGADVPTPFYTRMVAVLGAAAPGRLVFVDPTGYDGVLVATTLTRPPGAGVVFAPHYYDGIALVGGDLGSAQPVLDKLAAWDEVGRAWDTPVLLGEFGMAHDVAGADAFLRAHWDALDALGMHGTQWEYSVTGDHWNAESMSVVDADGAERALATELVRVYPEALAGRRLSYIYDATTRAGELTLDGDGTSSLVAPARLFPEGLDARVIEGDACAVWDRDAGRLLIGARGRAVIRFGATIPAP